MAITWTDNIKQQFRPFDISHMKQITGNALKLDDYESVKTWAGQIWVQVSNGYMPPGNPWRDADGSPTKGYKQNFKTWMDTGMPFGPADAPLTGTGAAVTW